MCKIASSPGLCPDLLSGGEGELPQNPSPSRPFRPRYSALWASLLFGPSGLAFGPASQFLKPFRRH